LFVCLFSLSFDIDLMGLNLCDLFNFFFCGVISILYLGSQVSRVNKGWLCFFKNLFFIRFYPLPLNYWPLSVVIFHLPLSRVIPGVRWSSISASPPRISSVSSLMVVRVARVAFCFLFFCFFFPLSYLIFVVALKKSNQPLRFVKLKISSLFYSL
jgi:hypothetical protein